MNFKGIKAGKLKQVPLSEIIFDQTLFPRMAISREMVNALCEKIHLGIQLDAMVVDLQSNRIIDGVHRWSAYKKLLKPSEKVAVLTFSYADEVAMLRHSAYLNLRHGERLNKQDLAMLVDKFARHGLEDVEIADVLSITRERVDEFKLWRANTATDGVPERGPINGEPQRDGAGHGKRKGIATDPKGKTIFLKRGLLNLSGKQLTAEQVRTVDQYIGNPQIFIVRQLTMLLETDVFDRQDKKLMQALQHLEQVIKEYMRA